MRPLPVEPVADGPTFVMGVALIRGQPVPVVDVAKLLGSDTGEVRRFVAVHAGVHCVALGVAEVLGTRRLQSNELAQVPPLLSEVPQVRTALANLDGRLLEMLEASAIIEQVGVT